MYCKRIPVTLTGHVTAEHEIPVTDAHLSQQRGRKVTLVTDHIQFPGPLHSTTCPHHRDPVPVRMLLVILFKVTAMVRHKHNQQVVPLLRLFHRFQEPPDALVHIPEPVILRRLELILRHIPRLMTAQRRIPYEEPISPS